MEYFSTINIGILPLAAVWINFKDINYTKGKTEFDLTSMWNIMSKENP